MVDVDLAAQVIRFGYLLVFLAMVAESTLVAGLVLPGMAVMFVAAFLAGAGELHVALVALAALLGTLVGDNMGYALGRFARRSRAVTGVAARFRETRSRLAVGYPRHYYLFQFPMPLRVAFPILVGSMGSSFRRWFAFDLVASCLFVTTLTTVGFVVGLLGRSLGYADSVLANLNYVLISAFGAWLLSVAVGAVRKRRAGGPAVAEPAASES